MQVLANSSERDPMIRSVRRIVARWAPEVLKRRFRQRLHGWRSSQVPAPGVLAPAARPDRHILTIEGLRPLEIPEEAVADLRLFLGGMGEATEEFSAFLREARRNPDGVLFDVGAYVGVFSWVFCAASPTATAVMFEPSPHPLGVARGVARDNALEGNIRFSPSVLGDTPGQTTAWIEDWNYIAFGPAPAGRASFPVEVTTVDQEVDRLGTAPTILKIDVEGHEIEVLRGARRTLAHARPVVFLELHLDLLEKRNHDPVEVLQLLEAAGYTLESHSGRPLRARSLARSAAAVTRLVARPGGAANRKET
jgi:FkbM family methyltransferase